MVINPQPGTHTRVKTRAATRSDWNTGGPPTSLGTARRTKVRYRECSKGKKKNKTTTRLQIHLKSYITLSMMLFVWGVADSYFIPVEWAAMGVAHLLEQRGHCPTLTYTRLFLA